MLIKNFKISKIQIEKLLNSTLMDRSALGANNDQAFSNNIIWE